MTYTRPISASLLASGLTAGSALGFTVRSAAGATLVARTTAGISEDGTSGIYSAAVAGWDSAWSGRIAWDAGAGTLAVEPFLPYAPQSGDVAAALPANFAALAVEAGTGKVTTANPATGGSGVTDATVAAAVWAASARSLTDKAGFSGTATNVPADFTAATFQSPGVFAGTALIHAPAGGGGGGGLSSGQVTAACSAAISATPAKLDLGQALEDTAAGTVGGALHGAWATAWGKVTRDRLNRLLKVFGIGSQAVPAKVFALDNADAPTQRVPQ